MGEFFHGWRRKIGVVTLLMACVVMAGWVRSISVTDQIVIPCKDEKTVLFHSADGCIHWTYFDRGDELSFLWDKFEWDTRKTNPPDEELEAAFNWRFRWLGFGVGKLQLGKMGTASMTSWIAPYWSITIPLTVISAWLFLSKPHHP